MFGFQMASLRHQTNLLSSSLDRFLQDTCEDLFVSTPKKIKDKKDTCLYASFLKGQGHQGIFSFVKGTL